MKLLVNKLLLNMTIKHQSIINTKQLVSICNCEVLHVLLFGFDMSSQASSSGIMKSTRFKIHY
jgi:hypothetical protein